MELTVDGIGNFSIVHVVSETGLGVLKRSQLWRERAVGALPIVGHLKITIE